MRFRHSQVGAIQDLYPNPPVLRYHRLAPRIEREFGQTTEGGSGDSVLLPSSELVVEGNKNSKINWLDMAAAFLLGYLLGRERFSIGL